ncbi:UvrD-helicase domain-containing protein [Noviherbaspirillum galbum]|uniref:DNA 3'-5' helicase n=1 Tax=Noviherbaspirillum galbum TaxID=2709383 RepID=A0A6B3SNS5_9BURK|nr:UvrD-helicase domain-containing protein [Noviherbaspirillum galbum]NEX62158.1 UvrD-helicase domain-containing protein [Noviherbaspirillum galbum]
MTSPPGLRLTEEQQAVIACKASELVVNAFAGTGKTTTLRAYAAARPQSRILYLAFNKAIADEAGQSFSPHVECRTMHSLAYQAVGKRFRHKLGALRPSDLTRVYRELDVILAGFIVKALEAFMYGDTDAVQVEHVAPELAWSDRVQIAAAAQRIWTDLSNPNTPLPLPHDGYLKLYQLSRPRLARRYDIILLDEAQDTNLVTAAIVLGQPCTKVLVGDRHQSIYAFRGSVDAMRMLPSADVLYLTHSMRFGRFVAQAATNLLHYFKGETQTIVGRAAGAAPAEDIDPGKPYAIISRTNAGVFSRAVEALGSRKVYFVGGVENYLLGKLYDVHSIWAGKPELVQDPFYREFTDFSALSSYARDVEDKEIMALVGIVKDYKASLPSLIDEVVRAACETMQEADLYLMTAHRSKGLEFDQVLLDDDFFELVDKDGRPNRHELVDFDQEVNLLYVALTRAKVNLRFNRQYRAFHAAAASGALQPAAPQDSPPGAHVYLAEAAPAKATIDPRAATESGPGKEMAPVTTPELAARLIGRVERAMLSLALFSSEGIAGALGEPVDAVAAAIAAAIRDNAIAPALFANDPHVREASKRGL